MSADPQVVQGVPPTKKPVDVPGARKLQREFEKAQKTQKQAMVHRHKMALKELSASQSAQYKEWFAGERDARRKYFEENQDSAKRRDYVHALTARRSEFLKNQKDLYHRKEADQDIELKLLEAEHRQKLDEFKRQLETGVVPSARLWPGAAD